MFLESLTHNTSSFVTLTYDQKNLPLDGSLDPLALRNWLKRFRKSLHPEKVRYFACGEYGDETARPHYHAAIFGVGIEAAPLVDKAWGLGFTYTAEFNHATAQYIAGYVVKKLTAHDDVRLNGRHPEFARMSLRPGIGATGMSVVAAQLSTASGIRMLSPSGDVPYQLKLGQKTIPLGRYLREVLRREMGMPRAVRDQVLKEFYAKNAEDVLELRASSFFNPSSLAYDANPIKEAYLEKNLGRTLNLEARAKIVRRKTL